MKLALQNVERAPELNPDVRAQLIDKLQIALREVQRSASIKDELDAAREEELAAARERQLLNDRLARDIEKEKQLIDRFNALIDERRYDEAIDVAAIVEEVDPDGVTPRVASVWSQLKRNDYSGTGGPRRPVAEFLRYALSGGTVVDSVPGRSADRLSRRHRFGRS